MAKPKRPGAADDLWLKDADYLAATAALSAQLKAMASVEWPAKASKRLDRVWRLAHELAAELDSIGPGWNELEEVMNRAAGEAGALNSASGAVAEIAFAAGAAKAALGSPKERPYMLYAARQLVDIWRYSGLGLSRPTLAETGAAVKELQRIGGAAGVVRSAGAWRSALASAMNGPKHTSGKGLVKVNEFADL